MKVDTSHLAQDDASSHEFSNIMHVGDFVDQGSPDGYVRVVVISAADWEIEQARVAALEADAARMNWIQSNALCADFEYKHNGYNMPVVCIQWPKNVGVSGNLRASIDAAMRFDDAMKGGA